MRAVRKFNDFGIIDYYVWIRILRAEDLNLLIENPTGPIIMLFSALCWAIGNVGMKSKRGA